MHLSASTREPEVSIEEAWSRIEDQVYFMLGGESINYWWRCIQQTVTAGQLNRVWDEWPEYEKWLHAKLHESRENRLLYLLSELTTTDNPFMVVQIMDKISRPPFGDQLQEHFGFSQEGVEKLEKVAWKRCGPAMMAQIKDDMAEGSPILVEDSVKWLIRTIEEGFDPSTLPPDDLKLCQELISGRIEI
ncbi:MAG TPA: hypothetical protein VD907_00750 [Verrucomicrobiae bacterium]|nr:hypothetical protein [Verrucomicrobiae bacterium]